MFNHTIIYEFLSFQVHENAYYSDFHHCFGMPSNSSGEFMLVLLIKTSFIYIVNIYTSVSIFLSHPFIWLFCICILCSQQVAYSYKLFVLQSLLKNTCLHRGVNPHYLLPRGHLSYIGKLVLFFYVKLPVLLTTESPFLFEEWITLRLIFGEIFLP